MKWRLSVVPLLAFWLQAMASTVPAKPAEGSFIALSYHDVVDDPRARPDSDAVTSGDLVQHFSWLLAQGFVPVSIDDILAARRNERPLPPKAVLLTFDDGYKSFYTRVYPLLQAFRFPAVLALVGSWLDVAPGEKVVYGNELRQRGDFLDWAEIKEMAASGLVEIASHSYDLHRGLVANPQGNALPAAIAFQYDQASGQYESEAAYRARIKADLERNSALIAKRTGKRPRVMAWPYGRHNALTREIAAGLDMKVMLTLEDGINASDQPLDAIRRKIVRLQPDVGELAWQLTWLVAPPHPESMRVMHVDLDYIYDPDPGVQERNLGKLLDRVKAMGINTVFLQAYADPDGDGVADAVYFPNRHLPMRADLFGRAAWQLSSRTGVRVYAWMPLLAFKLPPSHPAAEDVVVSRRGMPTGAYRRLTPFSEKARSTISDIYQDLGRHAAFSGVLFHDDATLDEFEDDSPAAREAYRKAGLPGTAEAMDADASARSAWQEFKTRSLTAFSREMIDVLKRHQPDLKTARNIYARVVLEPAAQERFAQSLDDMLANYDWVALMAMPYLEGSADYAQFIERLVAAVDARPGALAKTVFELQAVDWRSRRPIDDMLTVRAMRLLQTKGARNFGYYPDDPYNDHPSLTGLRQAFSLTAEKE